MYTSTLAIQLPYPSDWQTRSEYVRNRLARLRRAARYCKGRAEDVWPLVEAEIKRLEEIYENQKAVGNSSKEQEWI